MADPVVAVTAVSKTFGDFQAVAGASFTIARGECFGLLGPNGAGKSTLIRMLYGATSRTGGELAVLGLDPQREGRALRRRLGVVTQEDALDDQMTVLENMRLFASFIGLPKDVAKRRIKELLEFLSLDHRQDAKILTLSGGMKRRLVFVRALLAEPELLILDEPTTGLDPAVRQVLWDKIRELKQRGTTVLLTTHYMDEAEVLCDRLVILDRGSIKVEGAPRALIAEHCAGYVAIWKPSGRGRAEAATLHDLAAEVEREAEKPEVIRPSNLEDVFLKVTGRELGSDA
jgi:lipooligosaccharide transport system ATP-binding protein